MFTNILRVGQPLFSGLWGQDEGQWPQNGAQEDPHQHAKELLHTEGDGAQGQAAQGGPREVVEPPFLEVFKAHLDTYLCNPL